MLESSPNLGNLAALTETFTAVFNTFERAYRARKEVRGYPHELPLDWKGWRMSLVEAEYLAVVLSFPLMSPIQGREAKFYPRSSYHAMPYDIDGVVEFLQLGEVVFTKEFDLDTAIIAARKWGVELADEHIDNPRPSFLAAMTRMGRAYSKLFELEQSLRFFVEQVLKGNHPNDWWSQVPKGIRDRAEGREARPTNRWLEDYSTLSSSASPNSMTFA